LKLEYGYVHVLFLVSHGNIDQTLVNSLHGLLICEIGGLDCYVITTRVYISCPLNTHVSPIFEMHRSMLLIQECAVSIPIQYHKLNSQQV